MLLKSALILLINILLINAAIIQQRNIPVRVIYDESYKNLEEKLQLSPKELLHQARSESVHQMPLDGRKNLYEKLQLSPDELNEAPKHLPVNDEIEYEEIKLMERTVDNTNNLELFKQAEDAVARGMESLRSNVMLEDGQWNVFKQNIDEFMQMERNKLTLKQTQPNQNIIQQIAGGIQQIANNFQQNLQQQQQGAAANGTEDEQQPAPGGGGFQNLISNFQNGVQNLISNVQNVNNNQSPSNSTVLGDTGVSTTANPPNFISNIVNGVQQFFGQNQNGQQGAQNANGTQGDTGVPSNSSQPNPGQVIQNIGSQIGNAFNQFIGGSTSPKPAGASGDDGVTPAPGGQNFIQNIGNAFQNLNPFRPSTDKPGDNPVVAGIQNVGNQVQEQLNQQGGGGNPVEGVQNAISGAIPTLPTTQKKQ